VKHHLLQEGWNGVEERRNADAAAEATAETGSGREDEGIVAVGADTVVEDDTILILEVGVSELFLDGTALTSFIG